MRASSRILTLFLSVSLFVIWAGGGIPAQAQVVINEVLFDPVGVNTGQQLIEIKNLGSSEVRIGSHNGSPGYWLYFTPARWQFPPGAVVAPSGTVVVHVNRVGTSTTTDFFTGISGMRNLRANDAVGLFKTDLFGDPSQIVDFVQWGGAGNGGEDVADQAGIWFAFSFVEVSSVKDGASIAYDGDGDLRSDWCVDGTPTLGAANDGCTTSFAKSPVIISEIGSARSGPGLYHPAIEMLNAGSVLEDLGGKWIVLAANHSYQFPLGSVDTVVAPQEVVVVHLGVAGVDEQGNFYTGEGTFRSLSEVDSLSFHAGTPFTDSTTVLDFVQWGSAGAPLENSAVGAGVWNTGDFVDAADRRPEGSLASRTTGSGISRWYVDNTQSLGKPNDAPPQPAIRINEILVDPPGTDQGQGAVEIENLLVDEDFEAGGISLCTESSVSPGSLRCFTVPAGTVISRGGFLVLRLNHVGPDGDGAVSTGPFQELLPTGGVLLLYLTDRTSEIGNLVDYVRWGNGSTAWEDLALGVKLWPGSESVSVGSVRDGSSIACQTTGRGPDAYRIDTTPSIGEDNEEPDRQEPFRRGDCNDDSMVNLTDAIRVLGVLFLGDLPSLCRDSCDANNDASLDIADPISILTFLFVGGTEVPAPGPGPDCGPDKEVDSLTCNAYLSCF